jgi:hypothetical protein
VAFGNPGDRLGQIRVEARGAVDVAGGGTQPVPREECATDDDDGVLRTLLRLLPES